MKQLSEQLQPEFGSGFGHRQLELLRRFHRTFTIANALRSQLSWTQYRLLVRVEDPDKREFYEAEAVKNKVKPIDFLTFCLLVQNLLPLKYAKRIFSVRK
ncbi:hypothetical protein GS399_00830 [Pedobacter sp. HMF7647]|uniref:YhcG N-terminal domain-containing protein n=1 Tax=Hufsiella arboris TaxID=2695275 RepID=A0A7K1Y515_9SPHI|nr:hypothetical protein [Hufsiella arboris]